MSKTKSDSHSEYVAAWHILGRDGNADAEDRAAIEAPDVVEVWAQVLSRFSGRKIHRSEIVHNDRAQFGDPTAFCGPQYHYWSTGGFFRGTLHDNRIITITVVQIPYIDALPRRSS